MNIKIEKLDNFGRGIGRIDNKVCFIENALPLEEANIEITLDKKNYSEAKVIELLKESDYRIMPACPYYKECGGCHMMHMDRKSELIFKEEKISDLFNKLNKNIEVSDIIYDNNFFYRNKITLHGSNNKVGLYIGKSNEIIEIDECLICNEKINNIIKRLKNISNIKEAIIKMSSLNEIMLIIDGNVDIDLIKNEFNDINSLYVNNKLVLGKEYINEKIFDLNFGIYKDSFFQVNYNIMKRMYGIIIDYYKEHKDLNVLDLYCGTGTIGMLISKYTKTVSGVEENSDAIASANLFKDKNNLKNINFYLGKVEDNIDKFNDIDSIIFDPPRSGLDKYTKSIISKLNPKSIIYVSCDPNTLIRDLEELSILYDIKKVIPIDMFPNTYHVETLCILERK